MRQSSKAAVNNLLALHLSKINYKKTNKRRLKIDSGQKSLSAL